MQFFTWGTFGQDGGHSPVVAVMDYREPRQVLDISVAVKFVQDLRVEDPSISSQVKGKDNRVEFCIISPKYPPIAEASPAKKALKEMVSDPSTISQPLREERLS